LGDFIIAGTTRDKFWAWGTTWIGALSYREESEKEVVREKKRKKRGEERGKADHDGLPYSES